MRRRRIRGKQKIESGKPHVANGELRMEPFGTERIFLQKLTKATKKKEIGVPGRTGR
jgi:hypothetical protein